MVWDGKGERIYLCTQIVRRNKTRKKNQMWDDRELPDKETLEEV